MAVTDPQTLSCTVLRLQCQVRTVCCNCLHIEEPLATYNVTHVDFPCLLLYAQQQVHKRICVTIPRAALAALMHGAYPGD